jgi:hypothetical protein
MVDVLFVTGHSMLSPGAKGLGVPECAFWRGWAPSIAQACREAGLSVRVLHRREHIAGWTERQADLVTRIERIGPRALIDLHFNSGGYPGCTAIHTPMHPDSRRLATALSQAVAAAQNTKHLGVRDNRGQDGRARSWTGRETVASDGEWYPSGTPLYVLMADVGAACVLEPFDGSVATDAIAGERALESGSTQAAIAEALVRFTEGSSD